MRSVFALLAALFIMAAAPTAQAAENDSAADVIMDVYESQIASWETRDVAIPTYRMRYVYLNLQSSAEAADDDVIGPGSQYALDFNERILDDLVSWQNSNVATVVLSDMVPRLEKNLQAIATQVAVFGE